MTRDSADHLDVDPYYAFKRVKYTNMFVVKITTPREAYSGKPCRCSKEPKVSVVLN